MLKHIVDWFVKTKAPQEPRYRGRVLLGLLLAELTLLTGGCAGWKAVDTTRAIEAMTAGERNITYTVVPGNLAGMPENAFVIPTVPGKNVHFVLDKQPDGSLKIDLTTDRGVILDALAAAAGGWDAQKFAEDANQRQFFLSLLDRAIVLAGPFLNRLNNPPPPTTQPGGVVAQDDPLRAAFELWVKNKLAGGG